MRVKEPIVQGKLEESDPTNELIKMLDTLPKNNMTGEEYALMRRNYLVFLIAQHNFDLFLETTHGIKRKKHIEGLTAKLGSSTLSADGASSSVVLSAASVATPTSASVLTGIPSLSFSGLTTDTHDSKKKPKAK
ncbi:orf 65 [Ateline gammaherpesvirus 3]|uniref:Small capsomere-interacting protein n=1 Tax=Ateline herpesvirus 3 TaxID=85618 RepID=Q9YTK2_ATHV3|nr:orf 65 [Ateline gammaherpesvirus 3]AAC95589.1 orf 65 [Ateline gammaherpesvirus 3]